MRRRHNGTNTRSCFLVAAALALLGGCSSGKGPGAAMDDAIGSMTPPSPSEAARDAFNVYDPDKRRRSINLLSTADFGGESEYVKTYRLLVDDPDPTVRAAAIRALGRHGTTADVERIIPYLDDENVFVRWEAAQALQRLHDEDAIDPLITTLRDDSASEVRRACAGALAQYPRDRVFQALVGALSDDDYAVIRQALESLRTLTGKDFGENGSKWLSWADQTENLFAGKQPYYYPQYNAPPSFWDKLTFWSGPDDTSKPKRPRGLEVASAKGQQGAETSEEAPAARPASEPDPQPSEATAADRSDSTGSQTSQSSQQASQSQARAERPQSETGSKNEDDEMSDAEAEAWRKAHPLGATDGR